MTPYLNLRCRTIEEASRAALLADARYQYVCLRNDLPTFRSRAKQFEILNRMGALRRTMLRLQIGDRRYHEMSRAYRASVR